ncbi:hypothetical protein LEMLEM_LOCUS27032 [Lemmus lemmus]
MPTKTLESLQEKHLGVKVPRRGIV